MAGLPDRTRGTRETPLQGRGRIPYNPEVFWPRQSLPEKEVAPSKGRVALLIYHT